MEYQINLTNDEFYFPRTERWIMDSFNLNVEQAVLYQMILNKGYIIWTLDWLSNILGWSRNKLIRHLNLLVNKNIVYRHTMLVDDSNRRRSLYIVLYDKSGKRSNDEINTLISKGIEKLKYDYSEKRYYRKKKKKK